MQYDFENNARRCTIRFHHPSKLGDAWNFLVAAFALAYTVTVAHGEIVILTGGILFALGATFFGLLRMFGTSSLIMDSESVILNRGIFGIGMARKFARADVERLGYQPEINAYKAHEDAALALMVKEDVMPIRFAQSITPPEAAALFDTLKQSGSWIAELIHPVGTPMF